MVKLTGPHHGGYQDAQSRTIQLVRLPVGAIIHENLAPAMHTEEELPALPVSMLPPVLLLRYAESDEITSGNKGNLQTEISHREMAALVVFHPGHEIESYSPHTGAAHRSAQAG